MNRLAPPNYPSRARRFSRLLQAGHALRRRLWLDRIHLSGAVTAGRFISGLQVPGYTFYAHVDLTTAHVQTALAQTVPLAKTMDEQISRLRAWADGRARNASVPRAAPGEREVRRMEL
jgi:hypothetical protein